MWGLMGPETVASERRTRTLGVGECIRSFNDLAVPGMGGVWFGKQLLLATLGIAVTERVQERRKSVHNIEIANAVEALACRLALDRNGWKSDSRLRGVTKMRGKNDLAFAAVRKPGFYVTQPMRMATGQALLALGLVESNGRRFNSFVCSGPGNEFFEAACAGYNPCHYSKGILDYLVDWSCGNFAVASHNHNLANALSPLEPLAKEACDILRERLIQGDEQGSQIDSRRRATLCWVESVRNAPHQRLTWKKKPMCIAEDHWRDLEAGALFFQVRDTAISMLDLLEEYIGSLNQQVLRLDGPLPAIIKSGIMALHDCAKRFLENQHPDELANAFCRECTDTEDRRLIACLVARDERVLRLRDHVVLPGPAFRGRSAPKSGEEPSAVEESPKNSVGAISWPDGISYRVHNLFLLNKDLCGELSAWLDATTVIAGGE